MLGTLILFVISAVLWWIFPDNWFWIAAPIWLATKGASDYYVTRINHDPVAFVTLIIVRLLDVGTMWLVYNHPHYWWWIVPLWYAIICSIIWTRHRLFPAPMDLAYSGKKDNIRQPAGVSVTDDPQWHAAEAAFKDGNYQAAFNLLLPMAMAGKASAQNTIGHMYNNGLGVPKNDAEAVNWYARAANQGHILAQSNLGLMYRDGLGIPRNIAEAANWYRRAAEQGLARAQHDLGVLYDTEQGILCNDEEAAKWYRMAADQSLATSENNLGVLYMSGRGVPKNPSEGLRLIRKAAQAGDVGAEHNLIVEEIKKGELTRCECEHFKEKAEKGERFSLEDLDWLRVLNFGNPNFKKPSREKLSLSRPWFAGGSNS